ncbi:bifunctional 3-demethylubiquinone-9 3-methyltransferase/ 2-octaprenyl-6-hydroxy phenol methylase [Novipirellula galeiformis]|uniref:Bifunctional 3-demethylubiquinone-9 3-methyltransferase/ 2-octaprenyl-6-hydroxy phenol methylase n=1 Tax=Novipirellula galeiformis TaxID=2528004 RepID=A0A5C6C659_9BACT|nr:bifunctional 3-demethylubiquinone-9 3-methyltransferase/ 2-octaprenyl-6-hydroxy phenol methylase [Novipirellula galeiformis]
MQNDEILRTNRRVYDAMADAGNPLCQPAKDSELANPMATIDPSGWLGNSIKGLRVLCLAAGGGRQSSLYAAAGATVTVVDLSRAMLELDRNVAAERNLSLRIIETSMDDLSMLNVAEFDLVTQPVSTCYVPKISTVFAQVARVLRPGGLYISQHKTPTSLQTSTDTVADGTYRLLHPYYRDTPVPPPKSASAAAGRLRETGAVEFLHRWEQIVGGMCRAGFSIEDLVEPVHAKRDAAVGTFAHRAQFVAPYVRIKARRQSSSNDTPQTAASKLWIPQ